MVNRGVVFQVNSNNIIVHSDDGRFLKLIKKRTSVGSHITFFDEDIIKKNSVKTWSVLSVAALLLIVILLQPLTLTRMEVYAYVSLEHSGSVIYEINEDGIVTHMKVREGSGEELLDNIYIGMPINEVLSLSIKSAIEQGYIDTSKGNVVISEILTGSESDNYVLSDEVIKELLSDKAVANLYMLRPSYEVFNEAEENNVSVSYYFLAKKISDITHQPIEEILSKPLDQTLMGIDDLPQSQIDEINQVINKEVQRIINEILEDD